MKIAVLAPLEEPIKEDSSYDLEEMIATLIKALKEFPNMQIILFAHQGSRTKADKLFEIKERNEFEAFEIYKEELKNYEIIIDLSFASVSLKESNKIPKIRVFHSNTCNFDVAEYPKEDKVVLIVPSKGFALELFLQKQLICESVPFPIDEEIYKFERTSKANFYFAYEDLIPQKGHISALRACLNNKKSIVIGGNSFKETLNLKNFLLVQEALYPSFVSVKFDLTRNEKISFLRSAKAYIMPYRVSEPTSLMIGKALMVGTPIITTNQKALREVSLEKGFYVEKEEEFQAGFEYFDTIGDKILEEISKEAISRFNKKRIALIYKFLFQKLLGD